MPQNPILIIKAPMLVGYLLQCYCSIPAKLSPLLLIKVSSLGFRKFRNSALSIG